MATNDLFRRFVEKPGSRCVDARNISVHITRVDYVSGVFNNFPIMLLYTTTLREPGNLDQQLFIAKRNVQIIVGPGSQTLEAVFHSIAQSANQDDRNVGCSRILLDQATEFYPVKDRHHHIADYHIRSK